MTLQNGSSTAFSINSKEVIHEPGDIDLKELSKLARNGLIEDFSNGTTDWAAETETVSPPTSYRAQTNRSNDKVLAFTIDPREEIILAFVWEVHFSVVKTILGILLTIPRSPAKALGKS